MFHPDRHKDRLQALVDTAETVLLPVYSGKASAWAMCELTRGESMSPACTIHHWHKHKHDALGKLEQDLKTYCNVGACQRHVYQTKLPQSHMIVLNVAAKKILNREALVSGGVDVPCDAPFAAAQERLRQMLEKVMFAAFRDVESDLRKLARTDESVHALLHLLLDSLAHLLEKPIAFPFDEVAAVAEASMPAAASTASVFSEPAALTPPKRSKVFAEPAALTPPKRSVILPRAKPLFQRRRARPESSTLDEQGRATTDTSEIENRNVLSPAKSQQALSPTSTVSDSV